MRYILFVVFLSQIPTVSPGAIYLNNPPVLNNGELAYLNSVVGKFIIRSAIKGVEGATEDNFDNCTATLISDKWILTSAHCIFPTSDQPVVDPGEMRFALRIDGKFEFFHLSGDKIMGRYPYAAHEDWIFLELEKEMQIELEYPLIVNTNARDWAKLNGAVKNVTYLTYVFPDGKIDDVMSNRLTTPSTNCLTDRLTINPLEYFPKEERKLNWQEFDKTRYGISNCPSGPTGSGSPFFDTGGNIRAINSWQRTGDVPEYFSENILNAHLLSVAFYKTYMLIISGSSN